MPVCYKCGVSFTNWARIGGHLHNVSNRKYCLTCSPFGVHNTRQIHRSSICRVCGESDPSKFYSPSRRICRRCRNDQTMKRMSECRTYTRKILGDKCAICGYDTHKCSLAVHHVDPAKKDPNFRNSRGWSNKRIAKELEGCILLCMNCHCAVHSGCCTQDTVKSGIICALGA